VIGGVPLTLAYGLPIQPRNDPYITLVGETLHEILKATVPGGHLVDLIPILKHAPKWLLGASFHETARKAKITSGRLKNEPFEAAIQHMVRYRYRSLRCAWTYYGLIRHLAIQDLR